MGNEASLTRDCKLEKEVPVTSPKSWRLYQSRHRDGAKVSVFVYEPEKQNPQYIANAAKYLKVLRHPAILKFDGLEDTSDGIWLATEQVTPLENVLEELSAAEIVAGIYNILEGLVFLHERGKLSHNNLCLSSLFVSEDGSWKLGGVEFLCRFDQVSTSYLAKCKNLRNEKSLAPEEKAGGISDTDPGYARDVYSFGVLVEYLLEYLTELGDLTKTFEIRVQDECLNPEPGRRPKLSSFLEDRLFRNDYLQIVNFLKNITLKSEEEKRGFFSDLAGRLYELPLELVASRLARPLLSRFVLLDPTACEALIPHLLTPYRDHRPQFQPEAVSPLIPEKLFRRYVVPELHKIFHVRDAHIRCVLLEHFDCYVAMFDREMLKNSILPQILLGLRDTNDELVRLSLHSVAYLVPLLGGDVVVGAHRLKLFAEATPKFSERNGPIKAALKPDRHLKESIENNGVITKDNNIKDVSASSNPRQKTLQEIAREAEREKRRQEAKKRNEERRKRRQERDKYKIGARLTSDGESADEVSNPTNKALSSPDRRGMDDLEQHGQYHGNTDNEIEEELEDTIRTPTRTKQITDKGNPLKLKPSSKMRTSPPPPSKKSLSQIGYDDEGGVPSSAAVDHHHHQDDSWGAADDDTWAEAGDDDNWNTTDWGDIDSSQTIDTQQLSNASKHSRSYSGSSEKDLSTGVVQPARQGGMSLKGKSQAKPKNVPVKPRTVDVDIMSLDIKTSAAPADKKNEIDDLFADMQPDIKPETNSLWGMLNGESKVKEDRSKVKDEKSEVNSLSQTKTNPVNFAVADVSQAEVGEGWGDDEDWGGEDF